MTKHLTTKELPVHERPYEKFEEFGPAALSDAELLAVIIRSGANGARATEVAQELMQQLGGNLLCLCSATTSELMGISGIGRVKAIQLKCVAELSRRIAMTSYRKDLILNNPQSIAAYYMEILRHEDKEELYVCAFDKKCKFLGGKRISIGSVSASIVDPQAIFRAALEYKKVTDIVLLHNHPSGFPDPSPQDDMVTMRVFECGELMQIGLSDHIIIGDNSYYSYREHGKIPYENTPR